MFPSARKMALMGRAPSWALSFSCDHQCQWDTQNCEKKESFWDVFTYRSDLPLAWIDNAHFLILACGANEAAVATPADAEDHVRMHVLQVDQSFSCAHVPNDDEIIASWRRREDKNVFFYHSVTGFWSSRWLMQRFLCSALAFKISYPHLAEHYELLDATSQCPPFWSDPPTPRLAQKELRWGRSQGFATPM